MPHLRFCCHVLLDGRASVVFLSQQFLRTLMVQFGRAKRKSDAVFDGAAWFTSVYGAGNQDEVAYIVNIAVAPQPIVSYPSNSNWQEVFNPTW